MIRIRIDVLEKDGKASVSTNIGTCKELEATELEKQITSDLRELIVIMMTELANTIPGSKLATSQEDVETMRSIEDLNL